ncbi:uncharacterized protein LOC126830241 [Patella vulgata]|uniref:uncharacterized protein LOC126830241 n=1 Tax=Patella vulgata TaxID=6465 RepID=UPI00217FD5A7|nr:uncharacterized protein LOC126830241 [Patella vulgata]
MKEADRNAIYSIFCNLTRDFDPKYVTPALIQERIMTPEEVKEMKASTGSTEEKASLVIIKILDMGSVPTFVNILRHNNSFNHLAEMVLSVTSFVNDEETEVKQVESMASNGNKPTRIDIFTGSRRKVKNFGHYLKRLIHCGNLDDFQKQVNKVEQIWSRVRHDYKTDVAKRAEVADFMFTVRDCQLATFRIQNDASMYDHPFFADMTKIIPFTSNPILSSMSYIARHGAAVILAEPLDAGLSEMMHAKMHSEHIVPCKEAGMVYYQEIDIMVRKYENETTENMKTDMLNRCRLALGQFEHEDSAVKEDFTRMLYLRMANIYLGLNVFGRVIEHVSVSEVDIAAAHHCLKNVKATWTGMELRRKMFYYIAKAVLSEKRNRPDIALVKSKLALEMANSGKFKNEQPSIQTLIEKYEYENAVANENELDATLKELDKIKLDEEY